jgi:predicted  nucleic acid-binding Zn-ribbon protein
MKRLNDIDLERMVSAEHEIDAKKIGAEARKELKIKGLRAENSGRAMIVDCHNKTIEQAFGEIVSKINEMEQGACRAGDELLVITGKAGPKKQLFRTSITDGYLADRIKSWRLLNEGCYGIKIKRLVDNRSYLSIRKAERAYLIVWALAGAT